MSAVVCMSGIFLVLRTLTQQRDKHVHAVVLWKGVLKLWRKCELTLGSEDMRAPQAAPACAEALKPQSCCPVSCL